MRPATIDENQLLDRLLDVFRRHGYEGASLSRIAKATGLQRASLYHRFPGGKEQMATAVLDRADQRFAGHVLAPLHGPGDPARRLRETGQRLKEFYEDGHRSCLLEALSLGEGSESVRMRIRASSSSWIEAMARVAAQAGLPRAAARRRAEEAFIQVQGALVLSRATGDAKPFRRAVGSLPALLTRLEGT